MKVAPVCPAIIRGRVTAHHQNPRGGTPAIEVEVREVLKGDIKDTTLRILGDNGMLCRTSVSQFAAGLEYIFAINGPGSKPVFDGGPAMSSCGQYWLEVSGEKVSGAILPESVMGEGQTLNLTVLREMLAERAETVTTTISGEVNAGEAFENRFGADYILKLEPVPSGWVIKVQTAGKSEDLSRLTPPFHSFPNPRELEGWHFRNTDNTGPNEAGEKNVNAPGLQREFIFSPEVGKNIDGPDSRRQPASNELEQISRAGRGKLTILDYELSEPEAGTQAQFKRLKFRVDLEWREK